MVHIFLLLRAVHKLRHLFLDHSRPLPPPLPSCVIFLRTPPCPLPDDVIYEWQNDISIIDYLVRRTPTAHGSRRIFTFLQRLDKSRLKDFFYCEISLVRSHQVPFTEI